MTAAVAVALSLGLAALAAWALHRHELARAPRPSPCAERTTAVFASDAGETPDSVLLARLLPARDACIDDPAFVDQARRLMTNTQRFDEARALLDAADARRAIHPDELAAQRAWLELAESHRAWSDGDQGSADALHAQATRTASALRDRWPEWPLPYLLLDEAASATWLATAGTASSDHFQAGRAARSRVVTGAFVRSLDGWEPSIVAFVGTAIGLLALCAAVGGLRDVRDFTVLPRSSIATAPPGYVRLAGTVHVPPGAEPVLGPLSHRPAAWYEHEIRSGSKRTSTRWERSAQPFVVRDATGEAVVEPRELNVFTNVAASKLDGRGSLGSGRREYERLLRDGDRVVVLGELAATSGPDGAPRRRIRVAASGRRLFVSTFSEHSLVAMERLWIALGGAVFVASACVLAWAWYQRYHVVATP